MENRERAQKPVLMLGILLQIGVDDKDWIIVVGYGGYCISSYIFVLHRSHLLSVTFE